MTNTPKTPAPPELQCGKSIGYGPTPWLACDLPPGHLHLHRASPPSPPAQEPAPAISPRETYLLEVLDATRDVLATVQKELGWLPLQQAYSTKMTDGERRVAQSISDIDSILRREKAEPPPAADPRADDGDCNIGDPATGFTLADLATADESGATRETHARAACSPADGCDEEVHQGQPGIEAGRGEETMLGGGFATWAERAYSAEQAVRVLQAKLHAAEEARRLAVQERDEEAHLRALTISAREGLRAEVERLQGEQRRLLGIIERAVKEDEPGAPVKYGEYALASGEEVGTFCINEELPNISRLQGELAGLRDKIQKALWTPYMGDQSWRRLMRAALAPQEGAEGKGRS